MSSGPYGPIFFIVRMQCVLNKPCQGFIFSSQKLVDSNVHTLGYIHFLNLSSLMETPHTQVLFLEPRMTLFLYLILQ